MTTSTYEAAGVNVALGDAFASRIKQLAKREQSSNLLKAAGGYAAVYPWAGDQYLALTTDGVGTKVLLAQQFNQHHGVGIDLVAMCANDLLCVGAKPMLFLDYYATGKLTMDAGTALIEGILDGCDQAGMLLVGGETAEMPDVYQHGHYDLAGFAVGQVSAQSLLTGQNIQAGQKIIGLASNGIHSNGLSLARKLLIQDADLESLLAPTQIYVKPVLQLLQDFPQAITGISHITGGGWRNLFRLNPCVGFEITQPLPFHPIYDTLLTKGLSIEEGFKTFNMGMGLALMVNTHAEAIVNTLNQAGFTSAIIGEITDQAGHLAVSTYQIALKNDSQKGQSLQ